MKTTINRNSVVVTRASDQTAYLILGRLNVGDIIEFDKNLSIEASIREELPDFGFRWMIDSSFRYQLWFALDGLALQKFRKDDLSELCELLPDVITTKHFRFNKSFVRCIDVPSRPCKCCGHVGNLKRYYLTFNIEKI